ncbi:hypothetical protein B0H13DRAFT_1879337 [Mycena leptocephala]|nr:hypothetical protein B0H13DRAFT_1879337 [Mycena leptocephala]
MEPHLLDLVCDTVAEEMETRRNNSILPGIEAVTPAFMESWNFDEQVDHSPFLTQILETAAQTERAKLYNKKKKPQKLCQVVTQQLLYQSSNRCLAFQAAFGLFLWSTGIGYDSVLKHIGLTADGCMEKAIQMAKDPHSFNYDNMNISTSIHVEQRGAHGPAKVTSGTFAILYGLRNATWEHMLIEPIMKRFLACTGLQFNRDIRPSLDSLRSYHDQLVVVVIHSLGKYSEDFGYLKRDPESLSKYAIPGFHDQLTNARIRSGQLLRVKDVSAWERREIFQLGFGLFHLCLNLVWAILHVHRGSVNEEGSLSFFFLLMEKARLGNDQPDYHTLLAALMQVLDGLLLDAWMRECGFPTLRSFAESKPTPEKLREIAALILTDYATPMTDATTTSDPDIIASDDESTDSASSSDSSSEDSPAPAPPLATSINPKDDIAYHNIRLLTRDLLMVAVLNLLQAKGMNSTWDRLGNISVAIVHIHDVKKTVAAALNTSYQRTGHTTPDTSHLVRKVQAKVVSEGQIILAEKRSSIF